MVDSARFSLSVIKPGYAGHENNIYTFLLLTSDLKGLIENPMYYFDTENENKKEDLDALMLTQGWRRFTWKDVSEGQNLAPYIEEAGISLRGQLVDYYNHSKPRRGEVWLNVMEDPLIEQQVETDENGAFIFTGMQFKDSLTFILQARKQRNKDRSFQKKDPVFIKHLPPEKGGISEKDEIILWDGEKEAGNNGFNESVRMINKIDSAYFAKNNIIMLDELEVVEKSATEERFERGQIYGSPSHRLTPEMAGANMIAGSPVELLRRAPGVQVSGAYPNYNVIIRGHTTVSGNVDPLFLLNNVPVDIDAIVSLDINEIDFVDIITGPKAVLYGSRGSNGVVAYFTKTGSSQGEMDEREDWGITFVKLAGYASAREFYSPRYDTRKDEHIKPDFRPTLFWGPDLELVKGKTTTVDFHTSDEAGAYEIFIQGLGIDGSPFFFMSELFVE